MPEAIPVFEDSRAITITDDESSPGNSDLWRLALVLQGGCSLGSTLGGETTSE